MTKVGSITISFFITRRPLIHLCLGTCFTPVWWPLPLWPSAQKQALSVQCARDATTSRHIVGCIIPNSPFIRREPISFRVAYNCTPMSVGRGMKAGDHTLVQIAPVFTPASLTPVPLVPAPNTGLVIAETPNWSLGSGATAGLIIHCRGCQLHLLPVNFAFRPSCLVFMHTVVLCVSFVISHCTQFQLHMLPGGGLPQD